MPRPLSYLAYGEAQGVPDAYKCRTRSPWFRVPHVYQPDALLSYMSGVMPRLVANEAGVVSPNSLHILRLHPHTRLPSNAIAVLWQTSLTRLSVEIEGHALGGGMLKLEPTEAESVIVPSHQVSLEILMELGGELDGLIRNGDHATVQTRADTIILREGLGLSQRDCHLLRTAARMLQRRRCSRGSVA
jgi:adenine-specific DNA-methyltransferase